MSLFHHLYQGHHEASEKEVETETLTSQHDFKMVKPWNQRDLQVDN